MLFLSYVQCKPSDKSNQLHLKISNFQNKKITERKKLKGQNLANYMPKVLRGKKKKLYHALKLVLSLTHKQSGRHHTQSPKKSVLHQMSVEWTCHSMTTVLCPHLQSHYKCWLLFPLRTWLYGNSKSDDLFSFPSSLLIL